MLVHIIADYGPVGDLAFAEVVQRLKRCLPDAEPVLTPVPAFATLAAGFCIAQLGLNVAPAGTVIYHNVAPRHDEPQPRRANAGERLAFAHLPTGVRVIGVNAGYVLSFLREAGAAFRWVAVHAEGSQFRSRDLFPEAIATIVVGHTGALGEAIDLTDIPEVPVDVVAYVDGFGNLKTTVAFDPMRFSSGATLTLRIGGRAHTAIASDGTFAVPHGELAFAPGSSGWTRNGSKVQWMEVFLRGGSAATIFGHPPIGENIAINENNRE